MFTEPFAVVDPHRMALFDLLAEPGGLFRRPRSEYWSIDDEYWAARRSGRLGWALGPAAGRPEAERMVRDIRAGPTAARIAWAVHLAVLRQRVSRPVVCDVDLAAAVWGPDPTRRPAGWRAALRGGLDALTGLRPVDPWGDPDDLPDPGMTEPLLSEWTDAGRPCPPGCTAEAGTGT